jgi:hypothetical protein
MRRPFRIIGGWSAGITILLGLSYCSELPKYRFEQMTVETVHRIPGTRLVNSFKTVDPVSPVSWVWPAKTTMNFAWPDPLMLDRFYTITSVYGEKDPIIFLVDADCGSRQPVLYDLDQPENSFPALDLWGEPVVAPNGKTYRQIQASKKIAPPDEWLNAFCNTDWTAERQRIRQSLR